MIAILTAYVCTECVVGVAVGILLLFLGVLRDTEDVSNEDFSI